MVHGPQSASGRLGGLTVSRGQPYNVVLTHLSADFDSLAAAVGVAKLWNAEDRKASVSFSPYLALYLLAGYALRLFLQPDKISSGRLESTHPGSLSIPGTVVVARDVRLESTSSQLFNRWKRLRRCGSFVPVRSFRFVL